MRETRRDTLAKDMLCTRDEHMINQSIQLMDGKKGGCSSSHMMLGAMVLGAEGRIGCYRWACTTFFFRQGSGRGFAGVVVSAQL